MGAYSEAYLGDVVENQGKLFDFVAIVREIFDMYEQPDTSYGDITR